MNIAQRLEQPDSAGQSASSATSSRASLVLRLLTMVAIAGFAVGAYFGLIAAGTDVTQGNVQRIFYFHVAAFSACSVAFAGAVIGGIAYLRTRSARWDHLALAGVEVGFFLSLITLFTGMVWARPIWNTWWTWDPRLTSAAIMALTYAAYLMLRNGIESPERQRTFSAVYGILAFATVIFTFMITRTRGDTIHPNVIGSSPVNAQGTFEMVDNMKMAFSVNMWAWCVFITPAFIWWRVRLENLSHTAKKRRIEFLNEEN